MPVASAFLVRIGRCARRRIRTILSPSGRRGLWPGPVASPPAADARADRTAVGAERGELGARRLAQEIVLSAAPRRCGVDESLGPIRMRQGRLRNFVYLHLYLCFI